jgi:hypothetical protein
MIRCVKKGRENFIHADLVAKGSSVGRETEEKQEKIEK